MKKIQLTCDSEPEFKGQIIDIFEDYLSENKISLKDKGQKNTEETVILYGCYYDMISNTISRAIRQYDLMQKQLDDDKFHDMERKIMISFYDVLISGGYLGKMSDADVSALKYNIRDTFIKWGLLKDE